MAETEAVSSPAEAADVFQGHSPSFAEYSQYRETGELPAKFKQAEPAESAPAATPEETVEEPEGDEPETAPESDPEETQEPPQKGSAAEKRIKQLLAKTKELERRLESVTKQDAKPGSSPAQPQPPQNYAEYRQQFKPSAWIEEFAKRNPQASYEDATAAMADHLADVREHFRSVEQRVNAERQALEAKVSDARERYEDFDAIQASFLSNVISDKGVPLIPVPVLSYINDSDVLADLLYTIGSDEKETRNFVAMAKANPNKAIRYVAKVENLIAEELAQPKETPVRGEDGKFKAPEPKKTAAPKPPSPVSGGSSRVFDVNDESLPAEEWARNRNADLKKRGKL